MSIFITCCMTCSPYKILHLGQWKKSLLWNNPQKVLMKMHFGLWNCLKMLIYLVMKVVSILANFQPFCICTIWSVNGWTNKSFTMLLQFLLDFLPSSVKLPEDCYEAKKIIKDFGISYEKIHACPNDCILYWKENANLQACPNCNLSRRESNESKSQKSTNSFPKKRKKKATKILRRFPLKPILKRLFMSPKTANHMKWHANRPKMYWLLW